MKEKLRLGVVWRKKSGGGVALLSLQAIGDASANGRSTPLCGELFL